MKILFLDNFCLEIRRWQLADNPDEWGKI